MRHRLLTAAAGVLMLAFWAAPAQAEIVFLNSNLAAAGLEFTLGTVPIQDE